MTKYYFTLLYQRIISKVSEKQFKSEAYIGVFFKGKYAIYDTRYSTIGGYIPGEVKLGITFFLVTGDSTLDL